MINKSIPYIKRRGEVFQYVRRIPADIVNDSSIFEIFFGSKPVFRRSLRTKSPNEAQINSLAIEREFDLLINQARQQITKPSSLVSAAVSLSQNGALDALVISKFVEDRLQIQRLSWQRDFAWSAINILNKQALDAKIERRAEQRSILRKRSADSAYDPLSDKEAWSPVQIARDFIGDNRFGTDETSMEFAALVRAIVDQEAKLDDLINQMIKGDAVPEMPSSGMWAKKSELPNDEEATPLFSKVVKQFEGISSLRPRTIKKYRRAQSEFINVVGDKPIGAISKSDITKFMDEISKRRITRGKELLQITQGTLQSYKVGVSAPLEFAIDRDIIEGPNPCGGIKPARWCVEVDKLKIPAKRPFSISELQRVFAHPWFAGVRSKSRCYDEGKLLLNDMRYWAPVVAAHTGMRAGELAGLEVSDVKLEDKFPHIHLVPNKFRGTKNGEGRYIPILDVLIELGFDKYLTGLSKRGETRLFPDWEYPGDDSLEAEIGDEWANTKWIRAFNRSVIGKTFKEDFRDLYRSPISFHSFRGSFKTLLTQAHPGLLTNSVIGHYQDALDRAYLSKQTPAELYPAFHDLRYPDLKIPCRRHLV
ncbi:DUF6538 domain-containing protein [Parasphingorhabdus sp.]